MGTRMILKESKAPFQFILRNTSFSAPSKTAVPLAQAIQNLWISDRSSQAESTALSEPVVLSGGFECGLGGPVLIGQILKDLMFASEERSRLEARGPRQVVDEDDDEDNDGSEDFDVEDLDEADFDDEDASDFDDDDDDDEDDEEKAYAIKKRMSRR